MSKASLKRGVLSLDLKISRVVDSLISSGSLLYSDGAKCEKARTPYETVQCFRTVSRALGCQRIVLEGMYGISKADMYEGVRPCSSLYVGQELWIDGLETSAAPLKYVLCGQISLFSWSVVQPHSGQFGVWRVCGG